MRKLLTALLINYGTYDHFDAKYRKHTRICLLLARAGCRRGTLALKVVKEAAWVVTLRVAAAVAEEVPAVDLRCAVLPGLWPMQRAVAAVPRALLVPALLVAHAVPESLLALHVRARWRGHRDGYVHQPLAVLALEGQRAAAGHLIAVLRIRHAQAAVMARAVQDVLAACASKASWAVALWDAA